MDLIRKISKKFTKKFDNKVINRQYFRRKTGLQCESNGKEFCSALTPDDMYSLAQAGLEHEIALAPVHAAAPCSLGCV